MTSLLDETQNTLTSTQSGLSSALADAGTTHTKLTMAEIELSQTKTDLTVTRNKLTGAQKEIQIASDNLTTTLKRLAETEANFIATSLQLETTRQQSDSFKSTADNLQANLNRMATGYGYIFKDPTYQEMKSFIAADRTDLKLYDRNNYNCSDFSADVILNAAKQKIRCAYVTINYAGDIGHAIVVFNTSDRGLIYVEPQEDEEVNLQIGKNYYQCIIPKPGYYYTKPAYNDIIVRFTVIW